MGAFQGDWIVHGMQDWSLKQALDFVSQQRPQISPNAGFIARLIRLEESLHGTKTVKVRWLELLPLCSEC